MKRCRFSALAAGLILSGSLCLSGCSVGLKDAYSLKERVPSIEASFAAEDEAAKGFASDLCVISDEGSFDPEDVTSQAGALFDLTDREVLYSKDAFEKMYPASITKVMTSLIAIKYGNLEDQVTVTEDAVISESGATLCGIKPGDTLTLEQLLYGLMLPSGNDAGAAIAIHMAGSIDAFADMMNEEAKRLGATDTHFMNPHGLHDEDHYTTAYDLYLIFNEALKYPECNRFHCLYCQLYQWSRTKRFKDLERRKLVSYRRAGDARWPYCIFRKDRYYQSSRILSDHG